MARIFSLLLFFTFSFFLEGKQKPTCFHREKNIGDVSFMQVIDRRPKIHKALDLPYALSRSTFFYTSLTLPYLQYKLRKWHPDVVSFYSQREKRYRPVHFEKAEKSEGLYVLVHGLFCLPIWWNGYIKEIKQKDPEVHIFAPLVIKKGNCSLEEAASPILEVVKRYSEKFPNKPIVLIGYSNGGRIAAFCEKKLTACESPIKIVSIAAPHFGTRLMDALSDCIPQKITFLSKEVRKELKSGNEHAKQHLLEWKESSKLAKGKRERSFYGSTSDLKILDSWRSFPVVGEKDKIFHVHGESHNSIITKVKRHVLEDANRWMLLHRKESVALSS